MALPLTLARRITEDSSNTPDQYKADNSPKLLPIETSALIPKLSKIFKPAMVAVTMAV